MARLEWAVAAQSFSVDQDSKALSVFNVLENLGISHEVLDPPPGQQVALPGQFSIIERWIRDTPEAGERHTGRVRVIGPRGVVLGSGEFSIDLMSESRCRATMNFPFFVFEGVGDYHFVTDIKMASEWQQVNEIIVSVSRNTN